MLPHSDIPLQEVNGSRSENYVVNGDSSVNTSSINASSVNAVATDVVDRSDNHDESQVTVLDNTTELPKDDDDLTSVPAHTSQEKRVIFINRNQPTPFTTNEISTAKYNALTFFPMFLFEQFRRYSNCFFLMIALLQQIPDVSPTGRWTTLTPFCIILSVSAVKEIFEDWKRHRADGETNNRRVEVLADGEWKKMAWKKIKVGDILKINNNEQFPADLVVVASSEPQGMSFIETANLDGETNLKIRQAVPETSHRVSKAQLTSLYGTVECEPPNRHLYEFNGVFKEPGRAAVPLKLEQMLLRGAMLRNTAWVFAVVVYTGIDTKLMMNSTKAPLKRSSVDKATNTQILMLFSLLVLLAFVSSLFNVFWSRQHADIDWYLALQDLGNTSFAFEFMTFFILYNNLIPISLQVTAEIVRFLQAKFIAMDRDMYYEPTDTPANARTSNLNEELGMVKYVFSDKTGTLTCNIMEFKKCSIAENIYNAAEPGEDLDRNRLWQNLNLDSTSKGHLYEREDYRERHQRRLNEHRMNEWHMSERFSSHRSSTQNLSAEENLIETNHEGGNVNEAVSERSSDDVRLSTRFYREPSLKRRAHTDLSRVLVDEHETEDEQAQHDSHEQPHTSGHETEHLRSARHAHMNEEITTVRDNQFAGPFRPADRERNERLSASSSSRNGDPDSHTQHGYLFRNQEEMHPGGSPMSLLDPERPSTSTRYPNVSEQMEDSTDERSTLIPHDAVHYVSGLNTSTFDTVIRIDNKTVQTDVDADTFAARNLYRRGKLDEQHTSKSIDEFLMMLAVCHTVIPERIGDTIHYHAASPDERALVAGAASFGYVFDTRTPTGVELTVRGRRRSMQVLHVLEFTSTRKRMSVIVRTPDERIKIYCKGADSVIMPRLAREGRKYEEVTLAHLEEFATEGYRTLVFAAADIPKSRYTEWAYTYQKASIALSDREEKLQEAAELIERDLRLLGATAIEDKLQDGVPETIQKLLEANIHVWVLTGDKTETAINIAHSARLISHNEPIIILSEDSLDGTREAINRHLSDLGDNVKKKNDLALVVDGKTLTYATSPSLSNDFLDLCMACHVVVCCRVSPLQKAEIVELVSKRTKAVTLAIGDGANDVAMIQRASVGVGISGVEGLQAVCASDYSIAQFRYLQKLLLVHGAWNYSRISKLILYSFYKNICLYVIELWFAIYSAWSGQILFERWSIGFYNVLFTALPPFAIGLFDKVCSAEVMLKNPKLYLPSQAGLLFNVRVFWLWMLNALAHSILLYWLTMFMCQRENLWKHGMGGGYLLMGNLVYTYVVITVCLKAGLVTQSWTWVTHCALWGSIAMWFLFILIYSNVYPLLPVGAVMLGQDRMMFSTLVFYLGIVLIPLTCLIPDLLLIVLQTTIWPDAAERARAAELRHSPTQLLANEPSRHSLAETTRLLKNVRRVFRRSETRENLEIELSHGFAFSQEEGGTVSQTDIIRAYDTNQPKPAGS